VGPLLLWPRGMSVCTESCYLFFHVNHCQSIYRSHNTNEITLSTLTQWNPSLPGLGVVQNGQPVMVDVKMFMYLVGAVMLALNVLAQHCSIHGIIAIPQPYTIMMLWFVAE